MAHFAEIDDEGVVLRVIVADTQEWCEANLGGTWVQTSYNTHGNEHPEGRPLHKNYAGIGYTWDGTGFHAPQPYASWILNDETYLWEAPVAYPSDGAAYTWDEEALSWVEIPTADE
jgi:hypothetical protein